MNPAWAAKAGVVLVPEDRKSFGLILDQSIRFNITLPNIHQLERWRMIFKRDELEPVTNVMTDLHVRPSKPELESGSLSGGNQQKVVLAKWLASDASIFIFDEPTRGIDVEAKASIHEIIRQLTKQGVAVMMISSELPEIIGMSDRVLVMWDGKITGELPSRSSEEELMLMATGHVNNHISTNAVAGKE